MSKTPQSIFSNFFVTGLLLVMLPFFAHLLCLIDIPFACDFTINSVIFFLSLGYGFLIVAIKRVVFFGDVNTTNNLAELKTLIIILFCLCCLIAVAIIGLETSDSLHKNITGWITAIYFCLCSLVAFIIMRFEK